MPAFDYALLRAVWVPSGDAVTVGAVLQCRQARFLDARVGDADAAARHLGLDAALLVRSLEALRRIVDGGPEAGPVGRLPASERFHFLTATRSTSLQPSSVRTGVTDDPGAALDRIAATLFGPSAHGDRADGGTHRAPFGV